MSTRPLTYSAVLFDLDGTLLNTLEDLADSMNAALVRQALPPHPVDAYRYFVGDGAEFLVRRALPESHRDEKRVARSLELLREEYRKRWDAKTYPYPGMTDLLDTLIGRGLALAVLSNKPDDLTQCCVDKYLGKHRFLAVVGARKDIPKKPAPDGALAIARAAGILPGKFLYLGDTNTDMRTAVAAGMFPVGALWGFRPREELEESGARALCAQPSDVLKLIEKGPQP